jgi:hypothetical protein
VRDVIHLFNEIGRRALDLSGRVAVPAGSVTTMRRSSSRRPPRVPASSGVRSPAEACVNSPTTSPPAGGWWWVGSRYGQRGRLAAHSNLEGIERPGRRRQAGPHRGSDLAVLAAPRCFAFDQFGPLSIRPHHGTSWAQSHPDRLPATYTRTPGIRYFHGCYSFADDQLWGVNRRRTGGHHTLSAVHRSGLRGRMAPRSTSSLTTPASAANAASAPAQTRPSSTERRTARCGRAPHSSRPSGVPPGTATTWSPPAP